MTDPVIDKLIGEARDKYGPNSIMRASEMTVYPPISSGSLAVDYAVGIGGLPSDRCIEIGGKEATGKTTLALLAMKSFLEAQPERYALVLDLEHKITRDWAHDLVGQELWDNRVVYAQPDYAEQATNMYADLLPSGHICYTLFDSIAGAPTRAATTQDAEKVQVAGNSPAITKFARIAATLTAKYHCLTVGVNQERDDMEGFRRYITPGGRGWKAACVLRIRLRASTQDKAESVVNGEKMVIGRKIFAQMVKNQLAPEGRVANYWFYHVPTENFGFGIDTMDEIVRLAILTDVINQRSSWYDHVGLPGGTVRGLTALAKEIREDDALRATIVSETMAALRSNAELVAEVAPIDPNVIDRDEEEE